MKYSVGTPLMLLNSFKIRHKLHWPKFFAVLEINDLLENNVTRNVRNGF